MAASSLYIMNSTSEGFGLVLLEAMMMKVAWAARAIAGALTLQSYGTIYKTYDQLVNILKNELRTDASLNIDMIEAGYKYVEFNHTIKNTCHDILDVINMK